MLDIHDLPSQARVKRALARRKRQVEAARAGDVNAFCELIGEVPGGKRLQQDPVHIEWQAFWDRNPRSVLLAPVGHGKTSQVRHRLLHKIGRNRNIQIAYISATERHPKKVQRSLRSEIEHNPRVQWVFPDLRPGEIWTSTEFQVQRYTRDPDPTFQVFGAFSQSVLGSRADVIVFDDLCNDSNTLTEYARDRMAEWIGEVISRLKPNAEVYAIGHIFHENDQLQRWSRLPDWGYARYEAILTDDQGVERPLAPHVMSLHDIHRKAAELGPVHTEMMLFNRLPSKSMGRFRQSWFDRCLGRGRGLSFLPRLVGVPTYTGVDLGHRREPGHDLSVLFTIAVLPDGTRQVVDIRSGRWSGPEILHQIQLVHHAFGSIVAVENTAAQQYLIDFAEEIDCLPIRGHTTSMNKHDIAHGVESLGIELSQGRWMLPCSDDLEPLPEVLEFIKGCLTYVPMKHTSDHLMAAWIAREAARQSPVSMGIEIESLDMLLR